MPPLWSLWGAASGAPRCELVWAVVGGINLQREVGDISQPKVKIGAGGVKCSSSPQTHTGIQVPNPSPQTWSLLLCVFL